MVPDWIVAEAQRYPALRGFYPVTRTWLCDTYKVSNAAMLHPVGLRRSILHLPGGDRVTMPLRTCVIVYCDDIGAAYRDAYFAHELGHVMAEHYLLKAHRFTVQDRRRVEVEAWVNAFALLRPRDLLTDDVRREAIRALGTYGVDLGLWRERLDNRP